MSVKEVTYYVAICDCCGEAADYGDYSAGADEGEAITQADSWYRVDGKDLCDNCWRWPTDEEAEAARSDDAVRVHEVHPESPGHSSQERDCHQHGDSTARFEGELTDAIAFLLARLSAIEDALDREKLAQLLLDGRGCGWSQLPPLSREAHLAQADAVRRHVFGKEEQ